MSVKNRSIRAFNEINRVRLNMKARWGCDMSLVQGNKRFHNIHQGERCFIVGNGPSINGQDLSLLRDEQVFTVNLLAKHPSFSQMKPNYHFFADPVFLNLNTENESDRDWLESIRSIGKLSPDTNVFMPVWAQAFVRDNGLDKDLLMNYFVQAGSMFQGYRYEIDYTKCMPGYWTVVQYCITMAIYMGFSEIYLIGCDCTGIISAINSYTKEGELQYAYKTSDSYNEKFGHVVTESGGMLAHFSSWTKVFEGYQLLLAYCNARGVALVNATDGGILDSLPRVKYEDLFREQKE